MISTVGWRRELLGPALWGHTFYVASLLHGRSGNSTAHGEGRRGSNDSNSSRSAPIEPGGSRAEVVSVVGPSNS